MGFGYCFCVPSSQIARAVLYQLRICYHTKQSCIKLNNWSDKSWHPKSWKYLSFFSLNPMNYKILWCCFYFIFANLSQRAMFLINVSLCTNDHTSQYKASARADYLYILLINVQFVAPHLTVWPSSCCVKCYGGMTFTVYTHRGTRGIYFTASLILSVSFDWADIIHTNSFFVVVEFAVAKCHVVLSPFSCKKYPEFAQWHIVFSNCFQPASHCLERRLLYIFHSKNV